MASRAPSRDPSNPSCLFWTVWLGCSTGRSRGSDGTVERPVRLQDGHQCGGQQSILLQGCFVLALQSFEAGVDTGVSAH